MADSGFFGDWCAEIAAWETKGRHAGVVLSGVPFLITPEHVDVWVKLLSRRFGTCSNYTINMRRAGGGHDGSVTLGFDLGTTPMPTKRPKIPLVYGGTYLMSLDPKLRQVRVMGVTNCSTCPSIEGHCDNPEACAVERSKAQLTRKRHRAATI